MVKKEIIEKISSFLEENSESMEPGLVDANTDLIEAGILDSLLMVMLVSFFEDDLGVELDPDELTEDNFRSLESMSDFLVGSFVPKKA